MNQEVMEAVLRYKRALQDASDRYALEVQPALGAYEKAKDEAEAWLYAELEEIFRKETKP